MIEENTLVTVSDAILSLTPKAQFSIWGNDLQTLEWYSSDVPMPTHDQINQEIQRLQENNSRIDYQRQRAEAYPSIEEQLDLMFHGGYDAWRAQIQAIKDQFPK